MKTIALAFPLILLAGCSSSKLSREQISREHPAQGSAIAYPKPDPAFDAAADRLLSSVGGVHDAKKPPEKGYVLSPYAPERGYIDVRAFPSGSLIRCPYTGRTFRIP